jgi:hypothetical protein
VQCLIIAYALVIFAAPWRPRWVSARAFAKKSSLSLRLNGLDHDPKLPRTRARTERAELPGAIDSTGGSVLHKEDIDCRTAHGQHERVLRLCQRRCLGPQSREHLVMGPCGKGKSFLAPTLTQRLVGMVAGRSVFAPPPCIRDLASARAERSPLRLLARSKVGGRSDDEDRVLPAKVLRPAFRLPVYASMSRPAISPSLGAILPPLLRSDAISLPRGTLLGVPLESLFALTVRGSSADWKALRVGPRK